MIPGPWDPPIRDRAKKKPMVAGPIGQLEEVETSTLKEPAPSRTLRHRAWG